MTPPKDRTSAKWTDAKDVVFIELCQTEISKGNRPCSSFSKEGWKNIVNDFNRRTDSQLDQKQLKNRWDQMKKEWSLYKNLMYRQTGIGWDLVRKTIDATDEWWEEQITVNKAYKKFRNRDLTLVASKYDELFRGTVATGEGARASTQRLAVGILGDNDDFPFLFQGADEQVGVEGSGSSDEVLEDPNASASGRQQPALFPPSPDFEKGTSSGSKRKRGNATSIKEGIQSLLHIALSKSTGTSPSVVPPPGSTIQECMTMLNELEEIEKYTPFFYFSQSLFGKSGNCDIFINQPDDRARVGWLGFKYAEYERDIDIFDEDGAWGIKSGKPFINVGKVICLGVKAL